MLLDSGPKVTFIERLIIILDPNLRLDVRIILKWPSHICFLYSYEMIIATKFISIKVIPLILQYFDEEIFHIDNFLLVFHLFSSDPHAIGQYISMEQQPIKNDLKEVIIKLNHIAQIITAEPPIIDPHIRDYITLYVQHRQYSQQLFTNLCQHQILNLMFEGQIRTKSSTCILECLNLLLTNTKQTDELIYYFSQPSFHSFLFTNTIENDDQYIEYLSQLFKTIILRIKESERSTDLIYLFYNTKFPDFPLFTHSTLLAINKSELVRVTSQQCVLLIINMFAHKKLNSDFLAELPMLMMVYQLISEFTHPKCDKDGLMKFLTDLFFELRHFRMVLLLINNFIFNYMGVANLQSSLDVILQFFELLAEAIYHRIQQIIETSQIQRQQVNDILVMCSINLTTVAKFMTNKYIDGNLLLNYVGLSQNKLKKCPISLQSLKKYYQKYAPEHSSNKLQNEQKITYYNKYFISDMNNKAFEYNRSSEFQRAKFNFIKTNHSKLNKSIYQQTVGSALGFISQKVPWKESFHEWVTRFWEYAGLKDSKKKVNIVDNFMKMLQPNRCSFISQFSLFLSKIESKSQLQKLCKNKDSGQLVGEQTNYNNFQSQWGFNLKSLCSVHKIARSWINFNSTKNQDKLVGIPYYGVHYAHFFIDRIKYYLENCLNDCFENTPHNKQMCNNVQAVLQLSQICKLLAIKVTQFTFKNFSVRLNSLHGDLQGILFENCFKAASKYMGVRHLIYEKQFSSAIPYMKDKGQQEIIRSICYFECLQKIMSPSLKSIDELYKCKWEQHIEMRKYDSKKQDLIKSTKVQDSEIICCVPVIFNKEEASLQLIEKLDLYMITLVIRSEDKVLVDIDICLISYFQRNSEIIRFGDNQHDLFVIKEGEDLEFLMKKFESCQLLISEIVTATFVEYIQYTFNEVCSKQIFNPCRQSITETP